MDSDRIGAVLSFGLLIALAGCGSPAPSAPTEPANPTTMPAPPAAVPGDLHMTVSPIDVSRLIYITPMGAMSPWGHTLPTDHIYFYHHDPGVASPPVPVYAPAAGRIESIFNGGLDVKVNDIFLYRIGPLALADGIEMGATVEAGRLLGHHSVLPAFDFSVLRSTLQLHFANPLRYSRDTLTADGPLKYFDEPVRSALAAKVLRTGGEIDGRIDYDVEGTLSGNWYAEDLPVADSGRGGEMYYGVRKLSFARDVHAPDRPRISIGGLGMTGLWATADSDPDFTKVTPAPGPVVYRLLLAGTPLAPPSDSQSGWLLVQLLDAQRLRIEAVPLPFVVRMDLAGPPPATFSANAEIYLR